MRFGTRAFIWSFIPFAILMLVCFYATQKLVEDTVRDGLRSSLRTALASVARVRAKNEVQNHRFLRILGEDSSLKAGLRLVELNPENHDARLTVEEQLRELSSVLGFDFLLASNAKGEPVAGVIRFGDQLAGLDPSHAPTTKSGLLNIGDRTFQLVSISVDQADENLGFLSVGEQFDLAELGTPAVLAHNDQVIRSSIPGVGIDELTTALRGCKPHGECEMKIRSESFVSLPLESGSFGDGYSLRTFQSVDAAVAPIQVLLRNIFVAAGIVGLIAALAIAVLSSRSIVRPISAVIDQLKSGEHTGILPEFEPWKVRIHEIRELTETFNRAAASIRQGREGLNEAYVEFVGSLASALDARDPYTAGHSRRVSEYSCAIGRVIGMAENEIESLRIGALLHDVGKIGIADSVLQKADGLTADEFSLLKQHPTIGRRILEGVHGFQEYLPVVELHHENWNGTGYPLGLLAENTPLPARVVKVADAYDAMTTDRPYRRGMTHDEALEILHKFSGIQFDRRLVHAFAEVALPQIRSGETDQESLRSLSESVSESPVPHPQPSESRQT